jgi:molecular chaperone GrpE (heat shock protein)
MSYFSELLNALAGRARPAAAPVTTADHAKVQGRVAALEMDLRERDRRIAAMQKEYANLEASGKREAAGAGADQLEALFKRVAAPLSNVAALAALAGEGREVAVADVLTLLRSIEKHFKAAGLEAVGEVGAAVPFDVAMHQRMSGGMVSSGTPVVVRMPGYRFGGKVLLKAMVTAKELSNG